MRCGGRGEWQMGGLSNSPAKVVVNPVVVLVDGGLEGVSDII